jgi:hypothetical protein
VTEIDAQIGFYAEQTAHAMVEKQAGLEALVEARKEALLAAENRVHVFLQRDQS